MPKGPDGILPDRRTPAALAAVGLCALIACQDRTVTTSHPERVTTPPASSASSVDISEERITRVLNDLNAELALYEQDLARMKNKPDFHHDGYSMQYEVRIEHLRIAILNIRVSQDILQSRSAINNARGELPVDHVEPARQDLDKLLDDAEELSRKPMHFGKE